VPVVAPLSPSKPAVVNVWTLRAARRTAPPPPEPPRAPAAPPPRPDDDDPFVVRPRPVDPWPSVARANGVVADPEISIKGAYSFALLGGVVGLGPGLGTLFAGDRSVLPRVMPACALDLYATPRHVCVLFRW
jgi:hypothetical protein